MTDFSFNQGMYTFTTPLSAVSGVGPQRAATFASKGFHTVRDVLMAIPLRYEDRSHLATIATLQPGQLATLRAQVVSARQYYKGRRSIQNAVITDGTQKLKVMWFNNKFIVDRLKPGSDWLWSGKLNDRGMLMQPVVEAVSANTIHTNRLVPIYSLVPGIPAGTVRRLLKDIVDHLQPDPEDLANLLTQETPLLTLTDSLKQLHFPDSEETATEARERLALEELIVLIRRSQHLKQQWQHNHQAWTLGQPTDTIPATLPFELTADQHQALTAILTDLQHSYPMNRLLVGDVGSGKTIVAGLAARQILHQGQHAALVAPTRILAEQHTQTIQRLLPDMPVQLLKPQTKQVKATEPTLFIGTHTILNRLPHIKPALLVFDEQHRFGVKQRSSSLENELAVSPHILTMSATPIPRSLMLTIFSHLDLSVISTLPAGRQPTKTWLVPESKRTGAWEWLRDHVQAAHSQALVVCPFIDPSNSLALENVAAVTENFHQVQADCQPLRVGLLHGRLTKTDQEAVTAQLFAHEIDVLVTTPIVEVGLDLPAADIMVIEGAERFGLASLHQLRGRVGRAGQQGYCLLFTTRDTAATSQRLTKFSQITNGSELAELDLEYRGAGDLFGTRQHGFDQLQFASWTNHELIGLAQRYHQELLNQHPEWHSPLASVFVPPAQSDATIAAN